MSEKVPVIWAFILYQLLVFWMIVSFFLPQGVSSRHASQVLVRHEAINASAQSGGGYYRLACLPGCMRACGRLLGQPEVPRDTLGDSSVTRTL